MNYLPGDVRGGPKLAGRHRRWLRRAVALASTSQHPMPMAAIAVSGGAVVAQAVNIAKNRPGLVPWNACSRHAEQIVAARGDLRDAVVYVARVRKDGSTSMARPCRSCYQTLVDAGARTVVWTGRDDTAGVERLTLFTLQDAATRDGNG